MFGYSSSGGQYGSGQGAYVFATVVSTNYGRYEDMNEDIERSGPKSEVFQSHGGCSHSPPPVLLIHCTAEPFPVDPPAPDLPRRSPRARRAARRYRGVRSRPGARGILRREA